MEPTLERRGLAALPGSGAGAALALLFFAVVARFHPYRRAFELDPDEGITAILAALVARGHALYREIWTDHAPLFPHLLRAWFDAVGWDVDRGRLLILVFAALIVFALYDAVRLVSGHRAALCTVVLLCSSAYFVALGVTLMIGIPSIACAVLSVWAALRSRRSTRRGWLLASGLFMALSLGIKLFTGFLLPVIALWLVVLARAGGEDHPLRSGVLWLLFSLAPAGALFLGLAGTESLPQLRAVASGIEPLKRFGVLGLGPIALSDWPLVLLAAIGTVQIVIRRTWELLVWPLWATAALIVLSAYAPVWYHHYLLLSVAACPCAGVVLGEAVGFDWRSAWRGGQRARTAGAAAACAAAAWLLFALPGSGKLNPRTAVSSIDRAAPVIDAMRRLGHPSDLVVTDAPMFAFRAGLGVAPELAVVTMKRLAAGDMTASGVVAAIERHAPEQILLARRFPAAITDAVIDAAAGHYGLELRGPPELPVLLYVRRPGREVAGEPAAMPARDP